MSGKVFNCACNKQIVWHFGRPTIIACENCEITFYHDVLECPHCGDPVSYFERVGGEAEESEEDYE